MVICLILGLFNVKYSTIIKPKEKTQKSIIAAFTDAVLASLGASVVMIGIPKKAALPKRKQMIYVAFLFREDLKNFSPVRININIPNKRKDTN